MTRQVCVIGAGYVGLITGVGLAGLGHHVEIVETRPDRLAALRAGVVPIHEPGVEARLQDHLAQGSIEVASSPSAGADVVMVCVGTPIDASGESDLSQVESALASVRLVADQRTVIIVRSTLPPGSSRLVSQWSGVERTRVLLNPEFLRQGTALTDFEHPTRIVLGHYPDADSDAIQIALSLFEPITAPRLVVDIPTAELIKNGANAFLALRLSFANEMAALCEAYGAEAGSVLEGIGLDPRIGSSYMRPSFGFGGSCLPKELMAITRAGTRRGLPMHMSAAASEANIATQSRFVERLSASLGGLSERRIGLLGLAFKAGTDDVRESPALNVARMLLDRGASVVAFDPAAGANAVAVEPRLTLADAAERVADDADAIVVATEWRQFRSLDWSAIRASMRRRLVFDGRRLLDAHEMAALGFEYAAVGSPMISGARD